MNMFLPGITCAIALLLCGLYPLAMGAFPSPRSPVVPHVVHDLRAIEREALVVEIPVIRVHRKLVEGPIELLPSSSH